MQLPAEVWQLALWDRLDHAGAQRAALALEKQLPAPWRLARVEQHRV